MSNDDYIKNTYGFQDENIIIDKFDTIKLLSFIGSNPINQLNFQLP